MKEEISMSNKKAIPFVKWAGGKRQLLDKISERLPREYNNYYEPFIGGGAVLFELQPQNAIINDINASLINAYRIITDKPHEFIDNVKKLDLDIIDGGKEYYYSIREQYNDKLMKEEFDVELASFFVFINKHCFNGLYRVNGKGLFNVPYNNSKNGSIDEEAIIAASEYLNNVKIMLGDFELACEDAKKGDFLFFDSPYAPLNPSSFESYTKEGFDVESHERLAKLFDKLSKRGCYCMLTNHNTDFINELYSNKGYKMDVVSVKRLINSDASKRTGEEIIICNY
jgi:DNA adenine methylase